MVGYSSHPCLDKVLGGKRASDFKRPGAMTRKDFLLRVTTVSRYVIAVREFRRNEQHMCGSRCVMGYDRSAAYETQPRNVANAAWTSHRS